MDKEIEKLKKWVKGAVRKFVDKDLKLLKLNVYEPSVSHRIAVYLEKKIPKEFNGKKLKFDCEYDKHFDLQKTTSSGKEIRPDILVHKRNDKSNNILAIEIKKKRKSKYDEEKLKDLTNKGGGYEYKLGAFIYFPGNEPKVKWFID